MSVLVPVVARTERKLRFVFNPGKDVVLLRTCLQFNPWQLGQTKWREITNYLKKEHSWDLTGRAAKDRVKILLEKHKKDELNISPRLVTDTTARTGAEESYNQRICLLNDIAYIIADPLTTFTGFITGECTTDEFNNEVRIEMPTITSSSVQESLSADNESSQALSSKLSFSCEHGTELENPESNNIVVSDLVKSTTVMIPSPNIIPTKRPRLLPEDEIRRSKIEHDMDIEREKLRLKEEKQNHEFEIERKRLQLEEARLALETKREERLLEDSRKMSSVLEFQNKMLEMLLKSSTN